MNRPNIVLIMADDMGFSDIGCYGSEIRTPNLDRLAAGGARFWQAYNCARCCPTRAALLTGLYPHQAGVGHMVGNRGTPAYQGYLRHDCVTVPEVLRDAGYHTLMSGKWHVGGTNSGADDGSAFGDAEHPLPVQRGFDTHYGMLGGAGSYFNPPTLYRDSSPVEPEGDDYYFTDAISTEATAMIDAVSGGPDKDGERQPFFLYVAYTCPHWPLHAFPEDIERYRGRYSKPGWDGVRAARHERLNATGLLDPAWEITPRDPEAPAWPDAEHHDWEDLRMAIYAAQIERMDAGIGRILDTLDRQGLTDDTLVFFLSDNGGCAEFLAEDGAGRQPSRYRGQTRDGRPVRVGNSPDLEPGPDDTFASYDLPWANASNTPFRRYKHWVHEGGIGTPLIVRWPAVLSTSTIVHEPTHVIDIAATILDAAGAAHPAEHGGVAVTPIEGESFVTALQGLDWRRQRAVFWEHEGNRAVRDGIWKLVSRHPDDFELYNMEQDRTELHDLADSEPGRVREMANRYDEWADRCDVRPWPLA